MQERKKNAERARIVAEVRALIRSGLKAALATLDAETGAPYASLVTVATQADGTPVFLISTLARHTQNLAKDPRASLLFDGTDGLGDPLQGGRISVTGRAETTVDGTARTRFLARHPESAFYADFGDFAFYRLPVECAHYVGGFGSIHDLAHGELILGPGVANALREAENDIVSHMNEGHADAIALYATKLLGGPAGAWRMSGCDPEGCDLVLGDKGLRLVFDETVTTPAAARNQLVALAKRARG